MIAYHNLLAKALASPSRPDRTGTGVTGFFGHQMRFDLRHGFPLVTTKLVHIDSIIHELLWFLRGDTNTKYLTDNKVSIWNEWADKDGNLGPVYGKQWRAWEGPAVFSPYEDFATGRKVSDEGEYTQGRTIDQIAAVIRSIQEDPYGRRHIVSAWNPGEIDQMALPPCHALFQFYVHEGYLSCMLYQRSADVFLGVPFNIASYALLTHMIAHVTGLQAGEFVWTGGDCHLYANHQDQAMTQLNRTHLPLPRLHLDQSVKSIDDFRHHHIHIEGYKSWPRLSAPVAV